MRRCAVLAATVLLAACAKPAPQPEAAASDTASDAPAAASSAAAPGSPTPAAAPAAPASIAAEEPSTSRDPGKVVLAWAKAMSLKQWGAAYRYWGDEGARSGLTLFQFTERWGKLGNPEFELHPGATEGAAGSLFYTAPIVLIDGKRHMRGEIVLRRVNDVPGATLEQLRWHIESLSIEP